MTLSTSRAYLGSQESYVAFWIPSQSYRVEVTEFQPGAARRKLKEENMQHILSHVPSEIVAQVSPKITHWILRSTSINHMIHFDIVNFTANDVAFDDTLHLKINGRNLIHNRESSECQFAPDDCQLVIYNNHDNIIVLNKDVPGPDEPLESTAFHIMTVSTLDYTYDSRSVSLPH